MRLTLALLAILALGGVASADSTGTYEVSSFADFSANGELIDATYSFQVSVGAEAMVVSDLAFTVTDSVPNTWTLLDPGDGFSFTLSDGALTFASSLDCVAVGSYSSPGGSTVGACP